MADVGMNVGDLRDLIKGLKKDVVILLEDGYRIGHAQSKSFYFEDEEKAEIGPADKFKGEALVLCKYRMVKRKFEEKEEEKEEKDSE